MNPPSPPLHVQFMSRADVESFTPPPNAMLISISDTPDDKAHIQPAMWRQVGMYHFVDGGYDEEAIATFGSDFDRIYGADYFTPEKADTMRADIDHMVGSKPELLVVNCQAGRSRSAAVAQYISERYGATISQETPEANLTVLRLLRLDSSLNKAIQDARAGKLETLMLETDDPKPKRGFFSSILELFGIEQSPK